MTDKSSRTRSELEALVLAELRATSQCAGAVHVTVVAYDDHRVPATLGGGELRPGFIPAGRM